MAEVSKKKGAISDPKSNHGNNKVDVDQQSSMKRLLGFGLSDVNSWGRFVRFMNSPRDPAGLGVLRITYGILMLIDIPQERGMSMIDTRFGDPMTCHFPLFNFLRPLPVDWMYVVYLVMLAGALGILLGAFYRLSCLLFIIPYWYIFFLDKTVWNNHSYLYGLISFQLLFYDANRFWSIDSLRNPKLKNAHVPLWNYSMIRTQIFLVYFLAGLKKIDADWLFGYSMDSLANHWVFDPFKMFLTVRQVDVLIVHIGGFLLDLTVGFWLFFDRTRPFAFFFCGSFHVMNSQIFSIGMFPFAMLFTMPVFCYADWPRSLLSRLPSFLSTRLLPPQESQQRSDHCVYPAEIKEKEVTKEAKEIKSKDTKEKKPKMETNKDGRPGLFHHLTSCFFILYIAIQLFLPYSHFLTKGYNNWTQGLYGYSWDMMVHSWHTQHVKLHFMDMETGEEGYLKTEFFSPRNGRWASHADMIKQLGVCVSERLKTHGFEKPALYLDVWKSMNGRFQQRMWDPRVDIVTAPWSPFEEVTWRLPLLTELSDWRDKVEHLEKDIEEKQMDVTFVADFPGLHLENFVSEDFGNTTLEVLNGEVVVELVDVRKNVSLKVGGKMQIPAGQFHNVYTISSTPSCYMYIFVNTTALAFSKDVEVFLEKHFAGKELNVGPDNRFITDDLDLNMSDPMVPVILDHLNEANQVIKRKNSTMLQKSKRFFQKKATMMSQTLQQTAQALGHVFFGMDSVVTRVMPPQESQETHHENMHSGGEL
ncbi:vitamin K-dependent gamma-carboxylase-like [Asterias rubens]|uniref:vitamin K-dependent gamma-carboxylase-like n=1 Tax=Asterias rubens TaxID=7604 RepID=UPI001455221C|nr:vitamin K-dependent gamma-carboxylase-like [Asterias rubens]